MIFAELEPIIMKMKVESEFTNQFALELSHHERSDFVTRLHMVKLSLTFLNDIVKPKKKLLSSLKHAEFFSDEFKLYLKHLENKI